MNIRESTWQKDGQDVVTYWVTVNGHEVPCYDAQAKELESLDKLPEGWEIATSAKGKEYLKTPKKRTGGGFGGGAAAFRNTKEGQAIEQQSMDRRTAIMQAVQVWAGVPWDERVVMASNGDQSLILSFADQIYDWLRATANPSQGTTGSSTGGGTNIAPAVSTPAPRTVPQSREAAPERKPGPGMRKAAEPAAGSEELVLQNPPSGPCSHPEDSITLLNPAGEPLPRDFWRCTACGKVGKDS